MRIKQDARVARLAHFSSFPQRCMHLSKTNYRSITHTRSRFKHQAAEGQVQMIVHCQLKTYYLSVFTLVFQRELGNFTLVGSTVQKKKKKKRERIICFCTLQAEEIPYCSVHNLIPPLTWVTFPRTVFEDSSSIKSVDLVCYSEIRNYLYVCFVCPPSSRPPLPKL